MRGGGRVNDAQEKGRRERRMDLIDMAAVVVVVVYRIVEKVVELRKKLGGMTFLLFSAKGYQGTVQCNTGMRAWSYDCCPRNNFF